MSFLGAVMEASLTGLMPDGITGEAALVPYKGRVVLLPMYRGLLKLAYQSEELKQFRTRCVYKGDEFDYGFGLTEHLTHKPGLSLQLADELLFAYAIAELRDGGTLFEVMPRSHIDEIRKMAAADSVAWVNPMTFTEQARKSVAKRLLKWLRSSPNLARAITLDDQATFVGSQSSGEALVPQALREEITRTMSDEPSGAAQADPAPAAQATETQTAANPDEAFLAEQNRQLDELFSKDQ